uniref:Uncharacterized protein n=1 Tax=Monodon monoceros TaxID=40151 RepID=A0A8C6AW49_MONMO
MPLVCGACYTSVSVCVSLPPPPPHRFFLSEAVTAQKRKRKLAKQAFCLICSPFDCVQEKGTVHQTPGLLLLSSALMSPPHFL